MFSSSRAARRAHGVVRGIARSVVHAAAVAATLTAVLADAVPAQQTPAAPATPAADTPIFAPLTLGPAPSATRRANGAPGPKYWQNRADYDIRAMLDTGANAVRGTLTMRYTNRSPQPLDVIWLQTEENGPERPGGAIPNDMLDSVIQRVGTRDVLLKYERPDHKTLTKVTLAEPLAPGRTATLRIGWQFVMPKRGGRMGHDGSAYLMAQWYPRAVVYDDVKGWNLDPYYGPTEFYLEYGDYTMQVAVPVGFIVAGTGTLENPREVLTPAQIARLATAAKADTVVRVITAAELADGSARAGVQAVDGMVTWKFAAKNVRDAVWGAAPDYQWDATHWGRIMMHAFYRPKAEAWKEGAKYVKMAIQEYSERWRPYPYPQMSGVEGLGGGMEYPMLTFTGDFKDAPTLYNVISHETGHQWFPMVVGSNERIHVWMDEGINQFINTFSDARAFPAGGDQMKRAAEYVDAFQQRMTNGRDVAMDSPIDQPPANTGYQGYFKPAAVLELLRREVVGPEVFDKALRTYAERWAYKHPTPQDFFRTFEDVSKRNLAWFWREFFYEAPRFDQAVEAVTGTGPGTTTVTYANKGRGVLPIRARVTFADGSSQDITHPVDVWRANPASYTASYSFPGKTVTKVVLDPDKRLVDADRSNDTWEASAAGAPGK